MPPRTRARAGRPTVVTRGEGTGRRAGRGGRNLRQPRRVVKPVTEPEGQGNGQGAEANGGAGGAPDLPAIIAQQLQNLLPTILAQVENHVNHPEVIINDNV